MEHMMHYEKIEPLPFVVPERINPQMYINLHRQQLAGVDRLLPLGMSTTFHVLHERHTCLCQDIGSHIPSLIAAIPLWTRATIATGNRRERRDVPRVQRA